VAVGAIAFFAPPRDRDSNRAWQAYVANWLFFTGIAQGAVIFCAATVITKAKWNWSVRRISLAMGAFLPLSYLLLLPMLGLREDYFPWIEKMAYDEIVQLKAAYLNIPFLITRTLVGALVLFTVSLIFMYWALRPDLGPERAADEGGVSAGDVAGAAHRQLARPGGGGGAELAEAQGPGAGPRPGLRRGHELRRDRLRHVPRAPLVLDPLPGLVLHGGLLGRDRGHGGHHGPPEAPGSLLRRAHGAPAAARPGEARLRFLDLLGLPLLVAVHRAVVRKAPWEQEWYIHRSTAEWGPLSLLVIGLCFVVPFAFLMGRKAKLNPTWLGSIGRLALVGLWLERWLLIAPSLHTEGDPTITFWEPLIGLGFLGIFAFSVRWFLSTFPVVQLWQPKPEPEMMERETRARARRDLLGRKAGLEGETGPGAICPGTRFRVEAGPGARNRVAAQMRERPLRRARTRSWRTPFVESPNPRGWSDAPRGP
jgi:hypothetical protein